MTSALNAGATHALILMTRSEGEGRTSAPWLVERAIRRWLKKHAPGAVDLFDQRLPAYSAECDRIEDLTRSTGTGPQVAAVRLPAGSPTVSQLASRSADLAEVAAVASAYTERCLAGIGV